MTVRRDDLVPRQRDVVNARERVVLVIGGPGTGKTTTALWAAREELGRPDVRPWQRVLFLTFSRTAVAQIAKRAPAVFGGASGRIETTTFHGFAWRLIRAFGRYAGLGPSPEIESEARARLMGHRDPTRISYDQLIPRALALLRSNRLLDLVADRWPLVICDEFQDTSTPQWRLLECLGTRARLLLLADPNQMIYTFLAADGVGPQRLAQARQIAGRIVELEPRSFRDPSGAIPAMAEAIRERDFQHEAVLHAVSTGRLAVRRDLVEADLPALVGAEVARLRRTGARTVGIFCHSNAAVARLGAALTLVGVDHVLVGIPEAHAEALAAMAALCGFGVGATDSPELRVSLGTFLAACARGRPPALALQIAGRQVGPPAVTGALAEIERRVLHAGSGSIGDLVSAACSSWSLLPQNLGARFWRRAEADFAVLTRALASRRATPETVRVARLAVQRHRSKVLVEHDSGSREGPVQLMNFHQTKGREADAVILAYSAEDYWGRETEPFTDASRVVFVSLTRARQRVVVLLQRGPHALVAPFAPLADVPVAAPAVAGVGRDTQAMSKGDGEDEGPPFDEEDLKGEPVEEDPF